MDAFISDVWCWGYLAGFFVGVGGVAFSLKRLRGVAAEAASDQASLGGAPGDAVEPIKVVLPKAEHGSKLADFEEGIVGAAPLHSPPPAFAEPPARSQAAKQDAEPPAAGMGPAVAHLQNLKTQMEHFENEVHTLRGELAAMAQNHDNQFESLLKRLSELQQEVRRQVAAPSQAPSAFKPAPEQAPAQKAQPVSPAPSAAPASQGPEPVMMRTGGSLLPIPGKTVQPPAQQSAPDASGAEKTLELAPSPVKEAPPAAAKEPPPEPAKEPAPAPKPEEALILKPSEDFPRAAKGHGPVWPV